jgi:Protein of unknown function (DUF2624).
MKEKIINSYVNKLTKDDIISLSNKNNVPLSNDEVDIIFEIIKRDWRDILYNPDTALSNIKGKVSTNTYQSIIHFYNLYSDKLSLL